MKLHALTTRHAHSNWPSRKLMESPRGHPSLPLPISSLLYIYTETIPAWPHSISHSHCFILYWIHRYFSGKKKHKHSLLPVKNGKSDPYWLVEESCVRIPNPASSFRIRKIRFHARPITTARWSRRLSSTCLRDQSRRRRSPHLPQHRRGIFLFSLVTSFSFLAFLVNQSGKLRICLFWSLLIFLPKNRFLCDIEHWLFLFGSLWLRS